MKIPYGICNFEQIRTGGFFYADKTPFIPELEEHYGHVVFLRPRRFGKSTFVSMLEYYYDLAKKDRFDELFRGLYIHEHPTKEQGRYLVLGFDFSGVAADAGDGGQRRSFVECVRGGVRTFLLRYRDLVPLLDDIHDDLERLEDAETLLGAVIDMVEVTRHKIYVLIDEYDHFASHLLLTGAGDAYTTLVEKTGFVRAFYATLKSGTRGPIARIFVTGVLPLMLDDFSSGFNIAVWALLDRRLAALAGFTRADVERAVDEFLAARPQLALLPQIDRSTLCDVLAAHYDGYRFSHRAGERVFNPEMVLFFLREVDEHERYPTDMLDMNVRAEYGRFLRIGELGGAGLEKQRALLQTILSEGHMKRWIVERFGARQLPSDEGFVSLLYYLGMLTVGTAPPSIEGYDLEIPNRVIGELLREHQPWGERAAKPKRAPAKRARAAAKKKP